MDNTPIFDVTINDTLDGKITHLNVTQEYVDRHLLWRGPIVSQVRKPYSLEQYNKMVEGFYPDGVIDG
jgi:hypothetical protein